MLGNLCLIPILLYSYCRICRICRPFHRLPWFLCRSGPPNYHSIGLSVRSPHPWAFIPAVGAEPLEKIPPGWWCKKKKTTRDEEVTGMGTVFKYIFFLRSMKQMLTDTYAMCYILRLKFYVYSCLHTVHFSILAHIYIIDNCRWIICSVDNMYMVKGICLIVAMCLSCHGLNDYKASPYRVSEHCGCALEHYSSTYVEQ